MTSLKLMLIEHWYTKGRNDTDLGKRIGVTQSMINKYIHEKSEIPLKRKIQLAEVIGVDSRLLFPIENE